MDLDDPSDDPKVTISDLSTAEESGDEETSSRPISHKRRKSRAQGKCKEPIPTLEGLTPLGPGFYATAPSNKICGIPLTKLPPPKRKSPTDAEEETYMSQYRGASFHKSNYRWRSNIFYAPMPGMGALPPLQTWK